MQYLPLKCSAVEVADNENTQGRYLDIVFKYRTGDNVLSYIPPLDTGERP